MLKIILMDSCQMEMTGYNSIFLQEDLLVLFYGANTSKLESVGLKSGILKNWGVQGFINLFGFLPDQGIERTKMHKLIDNFSLR